MQFNAGILEVLRGRVRPVCLVRGFNGTLMGFNGDKRSSWRRKLTVNYTAISGEQGVTICFLRLINGQLAEKKVAINGVIWGRARPVRGFNGVRISGLLHGN